MSSTPESNVTLAPPPETRPPKVRTKPGASLFEPTIVRRAVVDALRKLDPRQQLRNPVMFIVLVGQRVDDCAVLPGPAARQGLRQRVRRTGRHLAVVHRAVRQLRRGGRRGPGQGAGRHLAQDPLGDGRPRAPGRRQRHRGAIHRAADRRSLRRQPGGAHPGRRRRGRGHRVGRRVGDHRRVGAGHPRVGRRPLGGYRRHPGAVGRDRRADLHQAGRELHRPHDRPRRRGQPAEDAQ